MKKNLLWLVVTVFFLNSHSCTAGQLHSLHTSEKLLEKAAVVLDLLEAADFKSLSRHVNPSKGLNFSPYSKDLAELFIINFSQKDVSNFKNDNKQYIWGHYDGSGLPISMTPTEYYKQFIYDINYKAQAEKRIIYSSQLKIMDEYRALYKIYPNSILIQYHFKGTEETGLKDFKDLILIFTEIQNKLYLEGLAHSESTV